jgi:methyl-accepting chemotaxis protein
LQEALDISLFQTSQITEVVHQTSKGAQDSAAAANDLARLSDELQRLVRQFKLE